MYYPMQHSENVVRQCCTAVMASRECPPTIDERVQTVLDNVRDMNPTLLNHEHVTADTILLLLMEIETAASVTMSPTAPLRRVMTVDTTPSLQPFATLVPDVASPFPGVTYSKKPALPSTLQNAGKVPPRVGKVPRRALGKALRQAIIKGSVRRQLRGTYSDLLEQEGCNSMARLRAQPQFEQRTPQWYAMRTSMLTASDFVKVTGTDRGRDTFALSKVATGSEGRREVTGRACLHGIVFEPVCRMFYESIRPAVVEEFGLIRHPIHEFLGASPDGICTEASDSTYIARAVEFKAPYTREIHPGEVPVPYLIQMQGQMEVLDLAMCDYLECVCKLHASAQVARAHMEQHSSLACGMIIEVYAERRPGNSPSGQSRMVYGPLNNMSPEAVVPACQAFLRSQPRPEGDNSEMHVHRVQYWTLDRYNLVTVRRNREWFQTTLFPALLTTWERVLFFRNNPDEYTRAMQAKHRTRIAAKPKYQFV
jgi:hypothetical protein